MPTWKKFTEEMPPVGRTVWVYISQVGPKIHLGYTRNSEPDFIRTGSNSERLYNVTHWMEVEWPDEPREPCPAVLRFKDPVLSDFQIFRCSDNKGHEMSHHDELVRWDTEIPDPDQYK